MPMQMDEEQIVLLPTSQGDHGKAQQAESGLPGQVDTDQQAGSLSTFGIDR